MKRNNDTAKAINNSEKNSRFVVSLCRRFVSKKGFSFTEVMITMSLFLLMAGVGIGAYFRYYTFALQNNDYKNVITHMKEARFRALKNPDSSEYGIHFEGGLNTVTIFKTAYSPTGPGNIVLELDQLTITDLSLMPSIGITEDITFQKRTGKTVNTGSFTISSDIDDFVITINSQGVVN